MSFKSFAHAPLTRLRKLFNTPRARVKIGATSELSRDFGFWFVISNISGLRMLRTTMTIGGSVANNSLGVLSVLPNTVCVQCVRWRRKPRWLPVAKSKMFRIPERPKIPEDEKLELQRLHNNYKTAVRSLRRHIREVVGGSAVQEDTALREATDNEDFERCIELNNAWNESIAKSREILLAKERKARKEQILQKIIEKEERERSIITEIDERVRQVKAVSVTFITEKNIDQAIQDALDNPVDHNWAIDENGTIHRGKYVKPEGEDSGKQKRAQRNF